MVDSNGEKKLRGIAKDLTHEYFGNSLAVGKYFIYRRRPIKIVDGQFMGTHGLSNFWDWKEVLPSGELSKKEKSGYGGDDIANVSLNGKRGVVTAQGHETAHEYWFDDGEYHEEHTR